MIRKLLFSIVALLGLSGVVMAGPSEGDWEIMFTNAGGSINRVEDSSTIYALGVEAGYFLTARHEIGFGATYRGIASRNDTIDVQGLYRYNLVDGGDMSWWYVGIDLAFPSADENFGKPTYLRPNIGRKWMLNDHVAFDINLGYSVGIRDEEREIIGFPAEPGAEGDAGFVEVDAPSSAELEFGFSIFF